MSQHDFQIWANHKISTINETLKEKGDQYSERTKPAHANFLAGAALLETSPMAYLMALATKHWHALAQWAAGRRPGFKREDIQERATDIIVYLLLLMYWSEYKTPKREPEEWPEPTRLAKKED
jgi:hypothetical protein